MKSEEGKASQASNGPILATLALSILLASLGTSIANIALPALAGAFEVSFPAVQWVVVGYLATLTVSTIVVGRLGDALGLRRVLVGGIALFGVASILCSIAPDLWVLVAARALQGIGASALLTLPIALVRQGAGEAKIGKAMGFIGTASALGTAAGPAIGGLLVGAAGWRAIFVIQIPAAVVALAATLAFVPRGDGRHDAPTASRAQVPLRGLAPSLLANVIVAAVMMTTLVVGPFYLALGLGYEEAAVGLTMAVGPVISIMSGIPAGRVVDAHGSRPVLLLALAMMATGAFLMAALPERIGLVGFLIAIVILTPGYQLFQAANNTMALADAPAARRGTISGLLSLSRNIGLVAGASGIGSVFAFGAGTPDIAHAPPQAIAAGMELAFLIAGGLLTGALAIAVWELRGRPVSQ